MEEAGMYSVYRGGLTEAIKQEHVVLQRHVSPRKKDGNQDREVA